MERLPPTNLKGIIKGHRHEAPQKNHRHSILPVLDPTEVYNAISRGDFSRMPQRPTFSRSSFFMDTFSGAGSCGVDRDGGRKLPHLKHGICSSQLSPFTQKHNEQLTALFNMDIVSGHDDKSNAAMQDNWLVPNQRAQRMDRKRMDSKVFGEEAARLLQLLDSKSTEHKKEVDSGERKDVLPGYTTKHNLLPKMLGKKDKDQQSSQQRHGGDEEVESIHSGRGHSSHPWKKEIWGKINLFRSDPKLFREFSQAVRKSSLRRCKGSSTDFVQKNRNVTANVMAYKARWS